MKPLTTIFLILALIAIPLVSVVVTHADTTELWFSSRDTDIPDQDYGAMWKGTHVTVNLNYDVKFARLSGDDEIKDGELKLVLPDGSDIRVWVGLGNDNVVLRMYKAGQLVKEKEIEHQQCGTLSCNEAKGSVSVNIDIECNGFVKVSAAGLTVTGSMAGGRAELFGDNDVTVGQFIDEHCSQPPGNAQPVGGTKHNATVIYALAGAGAIAALLGGMLFLRR